jgi:hypothetical protein
VLLDDPSGESDPLPLVIDPAARLLEKLEGLGVLEDHPGVLQDVQNRGLDPSQIRRFQDIDGIPNKKPRQRHISLPFRESRVKMMQGR